MADQTEMGGCPTAPDRSRKEGDFIFTQELFKLECPDETVQGKILGQYRRAGLRAFSLEKTRRIRI